uniref:(California timema) hypothetical protein n=1 Tax=Timema californicum TaxID=61474 RepID=A0A7R9IWK8_TIMCA|nr:unnamed protein product [Timema californicum]
MFEGHDTTTAAVCWSLFLLGLNPLIQARVQTELDDLFQGSTRSVTMKDLQEMKYLEQVIKESLRLYPSVPFIARKIDQDVQLGQKFALLEEKTLLSSILRQFDVLSMEAKETVGMTLELVLRPIHGINVKLRRRQNTSELLTN